MLKYFSLLMLIALQLGASTAFGAVAETTTVKGRRPTLSLTQSLVPESSGDIMSGIVLRLDISKYFYDPDGDEEEGSSYQWRQGAVEIPGATGPSFSPDMSMLLVNSSFDLVRVSPKTNPAITDPYETGNPGIGSKSVTVKGFYNKRPPAQAVVWTSADGGCKRDGARLPTVEELQRTFLDFTSATAIGVAGNREMCLIHGWPLNSCEGGTVNLYWTSDRESPNTIYVVDMVTGRATDLFDTTSKAQAVCRNN